MSDLSPPDPVRRILHIDMDAFYASIEQRDDPSLRGKPVAVGRGEARGVVAAASYEARRYGVRSAMPSTMAKRRCPELIFVKPRFEIYRAVSAQIHDVFARYTPLIQPLSLDEAYLDVTDHLGAYGSATEIAQAIRADIRAETGLTASAGVSYNRFLAKLASEQKKPDGLFVITPRQGPAFAASLPVECFHGIGPATARKMHALGIRTGADLRACADGMLKARFGSSASFYAGISRGIDHRPVNPDRQRKSIGTETTFDRDIASQDEMFAALERIAQKLWASCDKRHLTGRTVTVKVKYTDFRIVTRARSLSDPVSSEKDLLTSAGTALETLFPLSRPVRLLGVTLSALLAQDQATERTQLALFDTC
ncbi:DNA polymerase IV [Acetobacter oeni]|uniref:DNA polymerase IV n=1 Tax=Acetobacter oeni TaxID=304077 RepID=A0A511XMN6_9PROT|nr:DNA polymerase IV [Acetobacter oeni]MBB3884143.1 DNA polymerase-4 [Acetobacter oeni]NHO20145.1 DNA polymerase IV [Acetobacter oeni]GBR04367.1 DNA polymerase IV [Acetobacter oeni LMG 21952]GEN64211.1 DNA polymerase IV [Acetobacter oeni]